MSLKPHPIQSVPEETARVAQAAFPHGTPYLMFRDALGPIFQDEDFTALFPTCGQPGLPPNVFPLVTTVGRSVPLHCLCCPARATEPSGTVCALPQAGFSG
jgi:hypothetical protein